MAETHKLGGERGKQPMKCYGGVGAEENCETGEGGVWKLALELEAKYLFGWGEFEPSPLAQGSDHVLGSQH